MIRGRYMRAANAEDFDGADDEPNPLRNLPKRWEICERCQGNGKHDHPAFSNGITSQEWHEEWDEDSREGYLAGRYDVGCSECHGAGKVQVVDVERCSFAQKRALVEQRRVLDELASDEASERRIRFMEDGGRF